MPFLTPRKTDYTSDMRVALVALAALAAAGCASKKSWFTDGFFSSWDDRRVLCSMGADSTHSWPLSDLYDAVDRVVDNHEVMHTYGHAPGLDLGEYLPVFQYAHDRGVDFVTYTELVDRSHPRAAWAFSIDDTEVDTWVTWRDTLRTAQVPFTFFVSNWDSFDAAQIAELGDLAADGHDIEAHGLDHLDASMYADGPTAYFDDEVAPEIAKLEAAGFPISTFAYPFGAHTIETNTPILGAVPLIRLATAQWCYADDPAGRM
jgi:hypothetical protein